VGVPIIYIRGTTNNSFDKITQQFITIICAVGGNAAGAFNYISLMNITIINSKIFDNESIKKGTLIRRGMSPRTAVMRERNTNKTFCHNLEVGRVFVHT